MSREHDLIRDKFAAATDAELDAEEARLAHAKRVAVRRQDLARHNRRLELLDAERGRRAMVAQHAAVSTLTPEAA